MLTTGLPASPGAASGRVQSIVVSNYGQAGITVCLDHYVGNADRPIAIQVLLEARLQRFQCIAAPRHNTADRVGNDIAVSVRDQRSARGIGPRCSIVR